MKGIAFFLYSHLQIGLYLLQIVINNFPSIHLKTRLPKEECVCGCVGVVCMLIISKILWNSTPLIL